MELTSQQESDLNQALVNSYTSGEFDRMLALRLDKKRSLIAGDTNFADIVFKVVDAANRDGWIEKLIQAALEDKPDSPALKAFSSKYPDEFSSKHSGTGQVNAIADAFAMMKNILSDYQKTFQSALNQIDVLSDYKALHDGLHEVQFSVYPNIIEEISLLSNDKNAQFNLSQYQRDLRRAVSKLQSAVKRQKVQAEESEWVSQLDQAGSDLKLGIDKPESKKAESAVQAINEVIGIQPGRINMKLYAAIASENSFLSTLIKLMEDVCAGLRGVDKAAAKLDEFQKNIDFLKDIQSQLDTLIKEHNTWQEVDNDLRYLPGILEDLGLTALDKMWHKQKSKTALLYAGKTEDWATDLQAEDGRLEEAIKTNDSNLAKKSIQNYCAQASERFFYVDKSLLELCEQLRKARQQFD